jgi:hypothetical protein
MKDNIGWIEDPRKTTQVAESCLAAMNGDRWATRFYLQLKYARPTQTSPTGPNQGGSPMFMDAFTSSVKQIGYNQLLEVTDAATASVCEKLRTRVEPVAAKPDIARSCTLMSRLQDGVIDYTNFHAEATSAFEDSYCAPIGAVLIETEPNTHEFTARRLDPLSCAWHRSEGRKPVHFYCFEAMTREVLAERFPAFERDIERAADWDYETILGVDPPTTGIANTVKVTRAWRRRVGNRPGKYVLAIGNVVLNGEGKGEEWDYDFFPIVVARTRFDHKGFGGVPVARFIAPHHMAINRLARIAEDSFKGAVPVVFAHKLSGCNDWKDAPFQLRKWDGPSQPKVEPTNPVSQQVLARIDYHDAKSYAQVGINKAIAAGQAPKGVVAGVAMREVVELADARKAEMSKHWESMWQQAGHIIVALANEMQKVKIAESADVTGDLLDEINLKDIKLEKTDYRISYTITSALSKSVAGLLSDYTELKDLGFADTADMAAAIGEKVPDVQATVDRVTAYKRLAAKMVQTALERGEIPVPPSAQQGQQGLDAIVLLGQQAWCQAMLNPDRYSPENLEALRRLMRMATAKKGAPMPQPGMIHPGAPIPQNAIMPVGTPNGPVAHNQYEAASMGPAPGGAPPPAPSPAPQAGE